MRKIFCREMKKGSEAQKRGGAKIIGKEVLNRSKGQLRS